MSDNRASSSFEKVDVKDENLIEDSEQQVPKSNVRLGKISVDDLFGGNTSVSVESISNAQNSSRRSNANSAFHRLGLDDVPGFPPGFPSLTRRPDSCPQTNFLQPEVFMAAMAAAQQVVNGQNMRYSPEVNNSYVCSKCAYSSSSDMNSLAPNNFSTNSFSPRASVFHDKKLRYSGSQNAAFPNVGFSPPTMNYSPQQPLQKIRKPFFMPYITQAAAERGLKTGTYIKGTLRINQRNFEEAYVDNPESKPKGTEQQDVMIIGVHDRNRALHSDVVILRVKERSEWVVRDSVYQAWRSGNLTLDTVKDGNPMSVTPVIKSEKDVGEIAPQIQVSRRKPSVLNEFQRVSNNGRYTREVMLKLALEMDPAGQKFSPKPMDKESIPHDLDNSTLTSIRNLAIEKESLNLAATTLPKTPLQKTPVVPVQRLYSSSHSMQRRLNYRLLLDLPAEDWGMPDECLQKTAEVVFIAEQKNSRSAVGQLKMMADGNRNWALFSPNDSRMPRMMIPVEQLPHGFHDRPQDYSKYIFVASIAEWQATAQFARGNLYKHLGMAGDISAETEGLLIANNVDTREFPMSAIKSLPFDKSTGWKIDTKEYKYRRDFRDYTIFTIDPLTARDLDDALHVKKLADCDGKGNPGWEVGVHIADVSHFLQMNTELDHWACSRANTVYLVHMAVPMLPNILCEDLCSLNPDVERLTFSVVWKMNEKAEIVEEWFGRSVIKSCAKLAYEHAQEIIDHVDKEYEKHGFPTISNGKTIKDIKQSVVDLHNIAQLLRNSRIENGALRLDQPKLQFTLEKESGIPCGIGLEKREAANHLVEEFMLLANNAVAKKISKAFPKIALLRRHKAPKPKTLREVVEMCRTLSYPIIGDCGKTIATSLLKYSMDPALKDAVHPVLVNMLMKSMQLAEYFCTGASKGEIDWHHYALNMDHYTHFTSPIRRYPDVIVHRLLAASLGYIPPPDYSVKRIAAICQNSNDKKYAAKFVYETNAEMFFGLLVKKLGTLDLLGVVVGVLDSAFDVLLVKYGIIKRVYTNRLKLARDPRYLDGLPPALLLHWDSAVETASEAKDECMTMSAKEYRVGTNAVIEQTLRILSIVRVVLTPAADPPKYNAVIVPSPDKQPLTFRDMAAYIASDDGLSGKFA